MYLLVAKLGSNVTHIDILQRLMGLEIPNLDDKGMGTEVLATNVELRHDDGMVGSPAQRANPPLGRGQRRAVNDEGLVFGIPGGRSLQATHVGTVAQFRLRIATQDLVPLSAFQEKLVLFRSTLFPQGYLNTTYKSP